MTLNSCHALWIGEVLPPSVAGCLRSFARLGNRVVLHAYNKYDNLPPEVELRDAALVLPKERIFRHYTGSYAVVADYYRYLLLRQEECIWIDADLYCIRPFDFSEDCVFGLGEPGIIFNGVLKLPPESVILEKLLMLFEGPPLRPPWIKRRTWAKARILAWARRESYLTRAPRTMAGPPALSWFARRYNLFGMAHDPDVFYPVSYEECRILAQVETEIRRYLTPKTRTIHLYNEVIRREALTPEAGSLLWRIEEEGRGGPPALVL
jgi:hypothetical protein